MNHHFQAIKVTIPSERRAASSRSTPGHYDFVIATLLRLRSARNAPALRAVLVLFGEHAARLIPSRSLFLAPTSRRMLKRVFDSRYSQPIV
jgi:hypothetical protein